MIKGDVALVTGASRGIGKAIAVELARNGAHVALLGRDVQLLSKVQEECSAFGVSAKAYPGDIKDLNYIQATVAAVIADFGKVDHLINNAGVLIAKKMSEASVDELKLQLDTNVVAVFAMTQALLPHFTERKSGSVITISSLAGKNAFAGGTMYTASKHAVMGMMRSLMLEVRQFNIRVSVICPGSVDTELLNDFRTTDRDPAKILHPKDVADTVLLVLNMPSNALVSEIDIRPSNP